MARRQNAVAQDELETSMPQTSALLGEVTHAIELLDKIPMLRRYGSEDDALKEVRQVLERVKERL